MSTNYYGRIIPTRKRKDTLKKLIDNNDFKAVKEEVNKLYEEFHPYTMNTKIQGIIHLGKKSAGWKFLWNPNIYQIRNGHYSLKEGRFINEPDSAYYTYPLTKEGIKTFINREDVEIYDEYGGKQDKEAFWKMALDWTTWKGEEAWDADSYDEAHPEPHFLWKNEYTDFLESLGYTLSKYKSDFYSDGLRFATSTDFS